MKNNFFTLLIVPLVILSLFFGLVLPAQAQGISTPNEISLLQISASEIQLNGPYDSSTVTFGLPASWNLTAGAKLQLNMAVSFSTVVKQGADITAPVVQGGTLTVRFNGVTVGVLSLNETGEVSSAFDLPASSLVSQRSDGRMELSFVLDSGISCFVNQQMTVFVHTNSLFTLPHEDVTPDTSLINFPRPLNQDSVFAETAIVVVPDQPSSAELQAALTVAAGFGSMAGSGLTMDMTTVGKLTPDQQANNQLILVGKAASLPLLKELTLPMAFDGSQFKLDASGQDNGVVQMITSPWAVGKVALVVAGNTDAGVIKAAQAVSTGLLRPNTSPNLAIVENVQQSQISASAPVDQTLSDLALAEKKIVTTPGKAIKTLRFGSTASASYRFYMPPGQTVTTDAYFDLVFGHSTLLNYSRSGLVILVNSQPIGTVRMSDATAAQTTNHARFTIPATVILPGYNRIEIRSNLIPNDACTNPTFDGLWVTLWPESILHMPLVANQVALISAFDLSAYPAPFVLQPTLSTTAFVLPHDDLDAWRSALRVANFLGNRTQGALFNFATFYGDEVKDPTRANYNFLIIGRPTQLPIISEINANLPAPFNPSSDVAIESNMQVQFSIPENAPSGYVQLMASPWNPDNMIIAAFGNSPEGVSWAASALVDAPLRSRLAGNFAAISGSQVIATDTRLTGFVTGANNAVSGISPGVIAPVNLILNSPAAGQPSWLLPAIYLASILILVVLFSVILGAWIRGRKGNNR